MNWLNDSVKARRRREANFGRVTPRRKSRVVKGLVSRLGDSLKGAVLSFLRIRVEEKKVENREDEPRQTRPQCSPIELIEETIVMEQV